MLLAGRFRAKNGLEAAAAAETGPPPENGTGMEIQVKALAFLGGIDNCEMFSF